MSASSLIIVKDIEKRFGAQVLFSKLSISLESGERLAIIGPNGAGKSTLLKIMAEHETADAGSVTIKKSVRMSYVAQTAEFDEDHNILELCLKAAKDAGIDEQAAMGVVYSALASMRLDNPEMKVASMSGGQKKRLQIAMGLSEEPDVLLLDEPTNHLDIASIVELEKFLSRASFAWVVVSHDRWFLENAVSRIVEINPAFPGHMLSCDGSYSEYLIRKQQFLESEAKSKDSLENKVRTEQAWLRQGAKARSTKSKKRTRDAYSMMESLEMVRSRHQERKVQLEFTSSDRKTKKLAEFFSVAKKYGEHEVFSKLDLKLTSGQALGLLGHNGSGKSTFVNLLSGELEPDAGSIKRADDLEISHFRQFSAPVEDGVSLKEYLSPGTDAVVHRGKEVHVVSWGRRFQFSFEQMQQPFSKLSGGEKARARIAKLMLETPDILILDEPTNDLDIETLEMLEDSLTDFSGVLVLVSHDRFMINRVCNTFLGLDSKGGAKMYASYEQWESDVVRLSKKKKSSVESQGSKSSKSNSKKLSYNEQREFDSIEKNISKAESKIEKIQAELSEQSDASEIQKLCANLAEIQAKVDGLYARWEELEQKIS